MASYDGGLSASGGKLRIFVNAEQKGEVSKGGAVTIRGFLHVGCTHEYSGGQNINNCFSGSLGELRIYGEAWKSPARITWARTEYQTNLGASSFGMPIQSMELWRYHNSQ